MRQVPNEWNPTLLFRLSRLGFFFIVVIHGFHTEYLQEMLREKETYGILLVDANNATIATLQGKHLEIVSQMHSGVTGKTKAGGQ